MDIIKTITDWPVIVQGALGSALFWAVLELGQRIVKRIASRLSTDYKAGSTWALMAHEAEGPLAHDSRFICMYAALHYLLKAGIVSALSLALGNAIEVFSSVGFLIAMYFLFRALSYVPHTSSWGSLEDRKQAFQTLIAEAPARLKALKEAEQKRKD
ncbi:MULTISPECIES: hypothetical protein [Giesbergeria]|uniref:Reticulon-like protein n=1 Tax=Giesbergeria sinuosa TaxID=80883 RepID=A0ABV9QGL8_9BURK